MTPTRDAAPEDLPPHARHGEPRAHDMDLLTDPPSTVPGDELDALLSQPPPTARSLRTTRVLGAGLVLALGFVGGVVADQQWGPADQGSTVARVGGRAGGLPDRDAGTGLPALAPAAGSDTASAAADSAEPASPALTSTTGTVALVDGSVLYVSDESGALVRVEVGDATAVTRAADLTSIDEGDTVTVTGTTTDGALSAARVEVTR